MFGTSSLETLTYLVHTKSLPCRQSDRTEERFHGLAGGESQGYQVCWGGDRARVFKVQSLRQVMVSHGQHLYFLKSGTIRWENKQCYDNTRVLYLIYILLSFKRLLHNLGWYNAFNCSWLGRLIWFLLIFTSSIILSLSLDITTLIKRRSEFCSSCPSPRTTSSPPWSTILQNIPSYSTLSSRLEN